MDEYIPAVEVNGAEVLAQINVLGQMAELVRASDLPADEKEMRLAIIGTISSTLGWTLSPHPPAEERPTFYMPIQFLSMVEHWINLEPSISDADYGKLHDYLEDATK